MAFPTTERSAWAIVSRPTARPAYMHRLTFKKLEGPRASWLSRVERTPDGCWVWVGRFNKRKNGALYPVFDCRSRGPSKTSPRHSAFWWMMNEWFPAINDQYTTLTCGDYRCISPAHRSFEKTSSQARLSAGQALAVYRLKGTATRIEVAAQFGVSHATVSRIWHGRIWASVTGHKQDNLPTGQGHDRLHSTTGE
jgi:hypothetical protein